MVINTKFIIKVERIQKLMVIDTKFIIMVIDIKFIIMVIDTKFIIMVEHIP